MEKQIEQVTHEGIEYIDEEGKLQRLDFQSCYENWYALQTGRTDPYFDERSRQIAVEWKCVGQRNRFADPPYIEFFTNPITRFEFNSPEGFHELRRKVEKAGWRTSDLS
ncbi:MAG: hypothetical protein JNL42_19745 [Anaerolineae bacterium]|nr:hypothetical protein [Anaerolineae bacterium]